MLHAKTKVSRGSSTLIAIGIFIFVTCVYVLTSPGRIDVTDGQFRCEVAMNLVKDGKPVLRDPALVRAGIPGRDNGVYSYYSSAASLFAVPLVWLGSAATSGNAETQRFMFTLTSPVFGGLCATVMFLFYIQLGLSVKRSLFWALVSSFATLIWPLSTSVFDNAQHAFFLITSAYFAYVSGVRKSVLMSAVGGLFAGVLLNYQEYFIILIPVLALITMSGSTQISTGEIHGHVATDGPIIRNIKNSWRFGRGFIVTFIRDDKARLRFLLFVAAVIPGLLFNFSYNYIRFGSPLASNKIQTNSVSFLFGNPVLGLLGLTISPGKSILLYSPPIILGLIGIRYLWRHAPAIGLATIAGSLVLLAFLSNILFFGGDWCWGPRYLVVLLPLWALSFPFVPTTRFYRWFMATIICLGFVVQLLGLSVDHQRFFFERNLPPLFWADAPGFYLRESALFARPAEMLSLRNAVPETANQFNPSPYPESVTYSIFGGTIRPDIPLSTWMRQYQVFYRPRPWIFWMRHVDQEHRPVRMDFWIIGLMIAACAGLAGLLAGLRRLSNQGHLSQIKGAAEPMALCADSGDC